MENMRYKPAYTAKESARLHSYQTGYTFGRLYHSGNPGLSEQKLMHVVSTLRIHNMKVEDYKTGFIVGYLTKASESGNTVTATEERDGAMPTKEKIEELRKKAQEAVQQKTEATDNFEKVAYVNKIEVSGRLGKDAEFTFTPSGKGICKLSLAVWQPGDNAPTMWLDVVLWLNDDEKDERCNTTNFYEVADYEKGRSVVVTGRLGMREYKGKQYYSVTASKVE